MLTRTATRRSAAVVMVALVAMLLVATGGSARAVQARTSAGTGHVAGTPHHGRQVTAVAPSSHDHSHLHLDLATTPPDDQASPALIVADQVPAHADSYVAAATVTADGRAPPAL
ncbi:hypothetical protein [Aeromicrobium endophyticum]|uniref:Uncharacterized protein n=1 Tax=Aeromicrobium endophyticum TaxID=2292704 RepID=A0A371P1Y0_9ACTN|nr:hypothetical protein [Aeromicrobium endophyticum]REK69952.1 hypothetical protein DX116_12230 [Aeromicrobium endophyticum]